VQKQDDSTVKTIIFAAAFAITVALGAFIWWKMRRIRKILLEEQAERRQNREMDMMRKAAVATNGAGVLGSETATESTVSLVQRAESPGISEGVTAGPYHGSGSRSDSYRPYRPGTGSERTPHESDPYRPTRPYRGDEDAIKPFESYQGHGYGHEGYQSSPYRSQGGPPRRESPEREPFEPLRSEAPRPWV